MIDISKIRVTECGDQLLHHSLGVRNYNHSKCCNWCQRPLKYATQHLCSTCRNRNRLGTLYTSYRSIRKLSHLTRKIKKYNTPNLQYKIQQILLKTCEKSNFFTTNYYNYWKLKSINKGNFTKEYRITQICLAYTLDWINEPQNYNHKVEVYYRFMLQAVTRYMNGNRKYYSSLSTRISDYFGYEVLIVCSNIFY